MTQELTPEVRQWLETPAKERDYAAGAMLLLRITRNRILYQNCMVDPVRKAELIEYHLQKIYNARVAEVNREEVKALMTEVDKINQRVGLDKPQSTVRSEFQKGKRGDHDSLPAEIQQLWIDNADIRRRMSEAHVHLRLINTDNSTCPDADRYPWAKEIVALDKKYRDNWNRYDHYVTGNHPSIDTSVTDPRSESKKCAKLINLQKGRYAKSQDPALGAKIVEWYGKVINPTEKMTAELRDLDLLK